MSSVISCEIYGFYVDLVICRIPAKDVEVGLSQKVTFR
jgi:hypothetical protein